MVARLQGTSRCKHLFGLYLRAVFVAEAHFLSAFSLGLVVGFPGRPFTTAAFNLSAWLRITVRDRLILRAISDKLKPNRTGSRKR